MGNSEDTKEIRCKGIKKCVVEKTLGFEDYKSCLFEEERENVYKNSDIVSKQKAWNLYLRGG